MKKVIFVITCLIILSGCQPASERIAIAIGLTQTAVSLFTPNIAQTSTTTCTPTATNIPTPTLTPTPDLRIIEGDPIDFLLSTDDLPRESHFYLPNPTWTSRQSNNEVINAWGIDEGREYLEKTGRIEGQWIAFLRGSVVLKAPEEIYCEVIKFKTTQGAQITLKEYNLMAKPSLSEDTQTLSKEVFPDLGDTNIAYYYESTGSSGEKYLQYNIEATYYNFYMSCAGYGRKIEVKSEYVANLISIQLDKLKAAPLVAP